MTIDRRNEPLRRALRQFATKRANKGRPTYDTIQRALNHADLAPKTRKHYENELAIYYRGLQAVYGRHDVAKRMEMLLATPRPNQGNKSARNAGPRIRACRAPAPNITDCGE